MLHGLTHYFLTRRTSDLAIQRGDGAADLTPRQRVECGLYQDGDVRPESAMGREPHAAARAAAGPAAERPCGRQTLGETGIAAQHLHAERKRLDPRLPRQLVDEAFGEKGGVAMRGRP